jgi:peptidyl-prolyl cis-trans isomerase SurA
MPGLLAALSLVVACDGAPRAVADDVYAVVDGREIRKDEVERAYRRVAQPTPTPPTDDEAMTLRMNIVDELITQEVLLARAQALDLQVTDAEIDAAFAQRKGNLTEEQFQDQLRQRELTDADLKAGLRRELLVDKVIEREVVSRVNITDEEISAFYNGNRGRFNVAEAQYRVAQIVITPMRDPQLTNRLGDDATSPAQAQRKTAMLMERLKTGSDFAQLAMDYSEDPQTAQTGGDLGFIPASALEQVPPQLKDVVLKAQPGSVNVVSAGGGHTIVLLVAREPAGQRDLGTPGVRDGIRELLQERRTQLLRLAYITTARNGADIVNNLARQIVQAQAPPPGMTPAAPGGE